MSKLKFDYCECGCKGYSASKKIMGETLHYWIYWDLGTRYILRQGHGSLGRDMGVFDTYDKAIKDAETHALTRAKKAQES